MRISAVQAEGIDEAELPCRTEDPELYFAESPSDVELAKAICLGCPVRAECLAGALERREPWGVWGGELFLSGVVIPRKRPRGRPRKNPLPNAPTAAPTAAFSAA
jgi:WhiB family redox-sensing transcriptional regulator